MPVNKRVTTLHTKQGQFTCSKTYTEETLHFSEFRPPLTLALKCRGDEGLKSISLPYGVKGRLCMYGTAGHGRLNLASFMAEAGTKRF